MRWVGEAEKQYSLKQYRQPTNGSIITVAEVFPKEQEVQVPC